MESEIEEKLYGVFSSVATSLGYSDVHGRIIAALISSKEPLSLQETAKKTGYSLAAVSLSLDLLEIIGMIKKIKNPNDRKLYARIEGDILEGMRNAFLARIHLSINSTLSELESYKGGKNAETIRILEKEINRLRRYVEELAKVNVPK
ncbi:MAG: hypothetical protein HYW25_05010 [Candidatus Aenigmarchaeota archaeon]|nr:hypothetical protein [Candidatus Aenigmarchaeota archaeon]